MSASLPPTALSSWSQTESGTQIENNVYERTLDLLFPGEDSGSTHAVSLTILRFEPSFAAEREIVLKETLDGVEITYYKSANGNIYRRLSQLVQSSRSQDPKTLADRIPITVRKIAAPTRLAKKWQSEMFATLRFSTRAIEEHAQEERGGKASFPLDGTLYVLRYQQGSTQLSFKLYDIEIDSAQAAVNFKLVRWMNSVREYVESH